MDKDKTPAIAIDLKRGYLLTWNTPLSKIVPL